MGAQRPAPAPAPAEPAKEDSDTSSEEETDSSEESEEEPAPPKKSESQAMARSDIGPLLARSTNARNDTVESKLGKETPSQTRMRVRQASTDEETQPRYGATTGSTYPNRYGTKRDEEVNSSLDDDTKYPTARSRYLALKERRNRLARSKSSHTGFGAADDDDDDPVSPTTASPSAYLASRYGAGTGGTELSRSRSSHALKSRENSPERPPPSGEKDGAALSSWARYLKNKYGSRGKERDAAGSGSSSTSRRLSLGLPLRSATELASSDDDSKNAAGSPISPTAATAAVAG